MISRILFSITQGIVYTRSHPQLILVLLIIVVLPLAFLYSGQRFLDAGRINQTRLEKERVGMLHDALTFIVRVPGMDPNQLQAEIERIALLNPDIIDIKIAHLVEADVVPIVALDSTSVGVPVFDPTLYRHASIDQTQSTIFESIVEGERTWEVYRSTTDHEDSLAFIYTQHSLSASDALMHAEEMRAYWSLALIYLLILALAYWHIRNTDYRQLYEIAQNENQAHELFTNMAVHELRAPLTALLGYASMITESADATEPIRGYATTMVQSSRNVLALLNDLLEIARIQSGKLAFELSPIDISTMVLDVVKELSVIAGAKEQMLATDGTASRYMVIADQKRLRQVLTNMITNACKYTKKKGTITVALTGERNRVELRIKDTGMGLSAGEQAKLFAPFYRVERNDASSITGTGLGMWITKRFVEGMGGTIAVESIKEVGTHIVLTFKRAEI